MTSTPSNPVTSIRSVLPLCHCEGLRTYASATFSWPQAAHLQMPPLSPFKRFRLTIIYPLRCGVRTSPGIEISFPLKQDLLLFSFDSKVHTPTNNRDKLRQEQVILNLFPETLLLDRNEFYSVKIL